MLRHGVGQVRVQDMPELSRLRLITPVLSEQPASQDQIFYLMLLVLKGKLLVEVEQSLALKFVSVHALIVKVDLGSYSL